MDNAFNSPAQVLEANMKAGEGKVKLPLLKCILLGIMAGAFIAFGGASSNAAVHNIANQGLSKTLAGCIFPVGLMMIVFVGGELFTGDCLMIAGVVGKRFSAIAMIRTLIIVFFSNMIGAVLIASLVYFSGLLDYTGGALGAFTIKVAYGKATITPFKAVCSGILCNILVCMAVLMATAAKISQARSGRSSSRSLRLSSAAGSTVWRICSIFRRASSRAQTVHMWQRRRSCMASRRNRSLQT